MKNNRYLIVFCLLFLVTNNLIESQELDKNLITSKESYAEKIYLQLSSTIFTTDETVWFKTIVTDINNSPSNLSGILHVELIDFDERIINQKLLKLNNGIGDGFFQLNESMSSGRYLIRAYTEWNKNFNQDFITEYYIDVFAPKMILENNEAIRNVKLTKTASNQFELSAKLYPQLINLEYKGKLMVHLDMDTSIDSVEIKKDKEGDYRFTYLLPEATVKTKMTLKLDPVKLKNYDFGYFNTYSKTVVVDADYLDLQFFPEGGELVDGLLSMVAFKALDYKNEAKSVFGTIVDQYDSIIAPFVSNKMGMGTTHFKSNANKKYFGVINNEGVAYRYKLPEVSKTGHTLTVSDIGNYIRVTINSNYSKQDSVYFKAQSRGILFHDLNLKLKDGVINLKLEKTSLPEGITKLTVLNKQKQPVCERLFFNYIKDYRLNITSKLHLNQYSQRDKTSISLKTKDKDSNAVKANLSVLVFNKEQLGTMHYKRENILSYFLLNSELKGNIENPSCYFDAKNKNRYRDLDALMLTQGWRNYKYENLETASHLKINPEKSLIVSGTVGEYFNPNKVPKKPIDLTLVAFGKPSEIFTQQVDSTGHFNFHLKDYYKDEFEILIQSKNHKGKKIDYTINIDKKYSPKIEYKKLESIQLVETINPYLENSIERKQLEEAFKIASGTIALDEVQLSGYKLTPEREKMMELHGKPDVVIEDKELHTKIQKWSYGLFSVLKFSYPDDISVRRVGNNGGFQLANVHGADFTFIIIDGIPVNIQNYPLIESLPTKEIKSVEIIKNPKNSREYVLEVFGSPLALEPLATISFINIYTYSGKGLFGVQRTSGIFKGTIQGLTPKYEFYAPKYDDITSSDWKIPDLRSIVYWNPNVITDINGNAQVEFYNADTVGDMLVVIEGITEDGKIGYYETTYTVKEKIEK